MRRQRDDFAHKVSFKLAEENETIVFEDLKIQNMVKNHHLASAIMDSTWGKLRRLDCLQGRKAWWTGNSRQSMWKVAEMLKVWRSGSKVSFRESTQMSQMRIES